MISKKIIINIIIGFINFLYILKRKYGIKHNIIYSKYKSDKWIIFITGNPPNPIIDYLMNNTNNWKILVLGNKETIDSEWYKYKNSNILLYLSFKEQENLGFCSLRYISKNSFARKNIGYLFAIKYGAKEIYEIDDDIVVKNMNDIKIINYNNSQYSRISIGMNKDLKMINPYSYFGINDIWPRGFFLKDIQFENNIFFNYELKQIKIKPLIYQGLLNGEPDIDEIFYMTRKNKVDTLKIVFSENYPLLYTPGNFVPINSKNTKYLYDIFPSLPLFSSLNNRINDIYRGYILQTYAWKYKGGIIFLHSNIYKYGNMNIDKNNFINEKKLYFEMDNFLKILKDIGKKESKPKEFLIKLIKSLVSKKILKKIDLKIYFAFLKDLSKFNYIYSNDYNKRVIFDINIKNYLNISCKFPYSYISKGQIFLMKNRNNKLIKHRDTNIYNNILLILIYNNSKLLSFNKYMIQLYNRYFQNNINKENIIECKELSSGFYCYKCFRSIYNKFPNMKGYLYLKHDSIIKPWDLENIDFNIPWVNIIRKDWNISMTASFPCKNISLLKELNNIFVNTNYFLNKKIRWENRISKCFRSSEIKNILVDLIYFPNEIMSRLCDIV